MQFSIDFKEIETLIFAKTGLKIALRASDNELRLQPRNMGLIQNRVKVRIKIDDTYNVPNWLKFHVSAGVLSSCVVPKIMAMLDFMPEGSVARQNDGIVYVMLDKIPQLATFCTYFRIDRVGFYESLGYIAVEAVLKENLCDNTEDSAPALEDSWSETTSIKDREVGNTFIQLARAIYESDKIDEVVQEAKDELKDKTVTTDTLKDVGLSLLKKKWDAIKTETASATEGESTGPKQHTSDKDSE